jgi:phenylacetate-CoA ligase
MECYEGNMHLITHSAYAEFLPLEGYEHPSQEMMENGHADLCRIVLTGFFNKAMPIIRYDIGDFGAPQEGVCPCGRGYPLMRMDIGRVGSSLIMPDGRRVYSSYLVRQLCAIKGINIFQFRQISMEEVQLFVVKGSDFSEDSINALELMRISFSKTICPGMRLNINYVDDVPKTSGGKHRHVICEIDK